VLARRVLRRPAGRLRQRLGAQRLPPSEPLDLHPGAERQRERRARAVQPDASVQRYDIDIVFTGPDTYEMTLARVMEDGLRIVRLRDATFRRVQETPDAFRADADDHADRAG